VIRECGLPVYESFKHIPAGMGNEMERRHDRYATTDIIDCSDRCRLQQVSGDRPELRCEIAMTKAERKLVELPAGVAYERLRVQGI
jgi:hypothetical protein